MPRLSFCGLQVGHWRGRSCSESIYHEAHSDIVVASLQSKTESCVAVLLIMFQH